jgi:hypothetical protein
MIGRKTQNHQVCSVYKLILIHFLSNGLSMKQSYVSLHLEKVSIFLFMMIRNHLGLKVVKINKREYHDRKKF